MYSVLHTNEACSMDEWRATIGAALLNPKFYPFTYHASLARLSILEEPNLGDE